MPLQTCGGIASVALVTCLLSSRGKGDGISVLGCGILKSMFNQTFWKFVASFVTVVVATLVFIMIVGLGMQR